MLSSLSSCSWLWWPVKRCQACVIMLYAMWRSYISFLIVCTICSRIINYVTAFLAEAGKKKGGKSRLANMWSKAPAVKEKPQPAAKSKAQAAPAVDADAALRSAQQVHACSLVFQCRGICRHSLHTWRWLLRGSGSKLQRLRHSLCQLSLLKLRSHHQYDKYVHALLCFPTDACCCSLPVCQWLPRRSCSQLKAKQRLQQLPMQTLLSDVQIRHTYSVTLSGLKHMLQVGQKQHRQSTQGTKSERSIPAHRHGTHNCKLSPVLYSLHYHSNVTMAWAQLQPAFSAVLSACAQPTEGSHRQGH